MKTKLEQGKWRLLSDTENYVISPHILLQLHEPGGSYANHRFLCCKQHVIISKEDLITLVQSIVYLLGSQRDPY